MASNRGIKSTLKKVFDFNPLFKGKKFVQNKPFSCLIVD